ncbi:unnamed protein product [Diatraea saccharalis]|uniref:Mitochondrial transcription rescue factor 1 C-terminal domain-containing protein n=1 Tax=Diatraea saccharalis TaxID=40085 RepID=A0A9N9WCC3_9NEOP|nr:unnamed protein product [Diatraea saccharalis]
MNNPWRRFLCRIRPISYSTPRLHRIIYQKAEVTSSPCIISGHSFLSIRFKSKKQSADSDDEDNFFEDATLSKDSKKIKFDTTSMRTDIILKSALGVARNKIEKAFYESKIRLNGRKILKKSASTKVGDEIDIIKGVSPKNSDHLYVSRVEILNASPNEDSITVTARRFKTLLIENYDKDAYKASEASNSGES